MTIRQTILYVTIFLSLVCAGMIAAWFIRGSNDRNTGPFSGMTRLLEKYFSKTNRASALRQMSMSASPSGSQPINLDAEWNDWMAFIPEDYKNKLQACPPMDNETKLRVNDRVSQLLFDNVIKKNPLPANPMSQPYSPEILDYIARLVLLNLRVQAKSQNLLCQDLLEYNPIQKTVEVKGELKDGVQQAAEKFNIPVNVTSIPLNTLVVLIALIQNEWNQIVPKKSIEECSICDPTCAEFTINITVDGQVEI